MKKHILIILMLVTCLQAKSRDVDEFLAGKVGLNFFRAHYLAEKQYLPENLAISEITCFKVEGIPIYFIISFDPDGFIIIAAENSVRPVLGYSFSGSCSINNAPPAFSAWIKQFEAQILIRKSTLDDTGIIHPDWKKWDQTDIVTQSPVRGVAPLLTCNWNQSAPYNDHCPADPAGPGGHTYAGCVPVAMGQLMYYYRWPYTGSGNYSYNDSTYGTISADFETTTYLWNNMPNSITTGNEGIGTLLFHLGVSCDLVYGPEGSGMYNHKAAYAMRTHFRYSPQTQYLYRDSTTLNWDSVVIAHLERRMPLYYAGWSKPWTDGHAFVCDGYQDTCYFHFNFGWGGQNNGYYYSDNLTPGGNNFKLAQELIINAYPDTVNNTYPVYCSGPVTVNYKTGSVEDGSGPHKNYHNGVNCEWLIDPQPENDSISEISLSLHRFQTTISDTLFIYNGFNANSGLVASFSGDTLPGTVKLTGNKLRMVFRTHSMDGASGFMGTWTTKSPVWCTGTQTIIADTSVITDGSGDFDYHNNSVCRWVLRSASGGPLTVYFRSFETEAGKDVLRFYDMTSSDTLAALSGVFPAGNLPDSVTAPGGKMLVIFMTNNNTTAPGWEIYWPKTHTGIEDKVGQFGFSVAPNPVSDKVTLHFTPSFPQKISIVIMDLAGKVLLGQSSEVGAGNQKTVIMLNKIPRGFYLVKLVTAEGSSTNKMVIR